MNKDQALRIFNSRKTITVAMVGKLVEFQIVGNPAIIPVVDKEGNQVFGADNTPLMKVIYNTNLNSQVAAQVARNKETLKAGLAGEEAKINDWLNSQQISFSHIGDTPRYATRQSLEGKVQLVTTENGSLLTIDPTSVYAPKAINAAKASVVSLEDLLGEEQTEA